MKKNNLQYSKQSLVDHSTNLSVVQLRQSTVIVSVFFMKRGTRFELASVEQLL
jgi:hypothetical protein